MAIYEFKRPSIPEKIGPKNKPNDKVPSYPDKYDKKTTLATGDTNIDNTKDIEQPPQFGFSHIDEALKEFFSNIKVPSRDGGYKNVNVRISGGQKSYLYFIQNLMEGRDRVELPIIHLHRTSWDFNPNKYTPAVRYTYKEFVDRDKMTGRMFFRNWPFLINYSCGIWSAHKADAEAIVAEILPRFDPLASIPVLTDFNRGMLQAKMQSNTNSINIEPSPEDSVKIQYDFTLQCEGWIPLKTIKMPVIRGIVQTMELE